MRRAELSSKKLHADGERSPKANNSNIKRYSQFHILPYKPPKLKVKNYRKEVQCVLNAKNLPFISGQILFFH